MKTNKEYGGEGVPEEIEPMAENADERVAMKRQLGLFDGVAMIVGSIVGSGIFISPRGVLQSAGSPAVSIIVWVLCGLISFIGAVCYAELGKSYFESIEFTFL